jgi:lysophospholipase L1-like esterase
VNLALLAVVVGLSLGALEILFRYAAHRFLPGGEWLSTASIFNLEDEPVGYSLKPHATRILTTGEAYTVRDRLNSLGLNDVERRVEKEPGSRRILVLGDSFVFGQGVRRDESLPRLLDLSLPDVEVINAGIPGYGLEQEYLYFKDRGHRFEPDLVLLGFFMNDVQDPTTMDVVRNDEGLALAYRTRPQVLARARAKEPKGLRGSVSSWIRSHSLFYTFVRIRLDNLRYRLRHPNARRQPPDLGVEGLPTALGIYLAEPDPEETERWRRAHRTLDALKELAAAHGALLALFSVPAPNQISKEEFDRWARARDLDPSRLARNKPFEMIMEWCGISGTPCLDLLETLDGRVRDDLYFRHDLHWNPEGHRLATEAVRAFLASLGFS